MELLIVVALAGIAYLLFATDASGESDTVEDLGGIVDTSGQSATVRIAQAIARAEGFYISGSRPARNHNPGDMTADLIGRSTGKDGAFVTYANDADGWANLYAQVNAWLNGTSHHAGPASTIFDLSRFYTATEQDIWAQNVADDLGAGLDTRLEEIA